MNDYLILNDDEQASYNALTSPDNYGGAIAYWSKPCVVVYSVPVWIMPNGFCRVGHPNADMVDTQTAITTIRNLVDKRKDTRMSGIIPPQPACPDYDYIADSGDVDAYIAAWEAFPDERETLEDIFPDLHAAWKEGTP